VAAQLPVAEGVAIVGIAAKGVVAMVRLVGDSTNAGVEAAMSIKL
jgi:hypothetical protein